MLVSGVVTIGSIHAGKAGNVIPPEVRMEGTTRDRDPAVAKVIEEKLEAIGTKGDRDMAKEAGEAKLD